VERSLDYGSLYLLQDRVLTIVQALDNAFYLTGGTALHRFYYGARYSDDLDFFVSEGENFHEDIKEITDALIESGTPFCKDVNARDFFRITVDSLLQIDFVNDRVYRYGKSNIINKIRVDNKINILTNKITAILTRDEAKDIFDLFCLAYNEAFNWGEILKIAEKKAIVEKDFLIYRLKSFPLSWLDKIKIIKSVEITSKKIEILCQDIIKESDNRLKMGSI